MKVNIQKTKITASGPTTSWQIEGKKVKAMAGFVFLGSKITANSDCSHEIKRLLLDSILKSGDITLPTKVHIVRAVVFPVVMYRGENCIIKKAKHGRIATFKLWCWRRLLTVPWTARRSNQSVLKEINP